MHFSSVCYFLASLLFLLGGSSVWADAPTRAESLELNREAKPDTVQIRPGEGMLVTATSGSRATVLAVVPPSSRGSSISFFPPAEFDDDVISFNTFEGFIVQYSDIEPLSKMLVTQQNEKSRSSSYKASKADVERAASQLRSELTKRAPSASVVKEYSLTFAGASVTNVSFEALEELKQAKLIKAYWPNYVVRAAMEHSVPLTKAPQVWQSGYEGRGVGIGVLDSGIDYTHEMFGSCTDVQYLSGNCPKVRLGYDFVDNDLNPEDCNGHGTHVASVAAGNGTLRGVAPEAVIIPLRVLNCDGNGYRDDIISAIEWSADPNSDGDPSDHLKIINISLGGIGDPDDPLSQAVDNVALLGVLPVVAAGDAGSARKSILSPGVARHAFTVASTYADDEVDFLSSRGPVVWGNGADGFWTLMKPDISAPGVEICAARAANTEIGSTCRGDTFVYASGTSLAVPHVSGAAALLMEAHPTWNARQTRAALHATALSLVDPYLEAPFEPQAQGAGFIDVAAAAALSEPIVIQLDPLYHSGRNLNIRGTIQAEQPHPYVIEIASTVQDAPVGEWSVIGSGTAAAGNFPFSHSLDLSPYQNGSYLVRVKVIDASGNQFYDLAAVERKSVKLLEPNQYETVNSNDPIQVRLEVTPGFEISTLLIEYWCHGTWNSTGTTTDLSNPRFPRGTIPAGALNPCSTPNFHNLRFTVQAPGTAPVEIERLVKGQATLFPGFPIRTPWPREVLFGEEVNIWPGSMQPALGDVLGDSEEEIIVAMAGFEAFGDPPQIRIYSKSSQLLRTLPLTSGRLGVNWPTGLNGTSLRTTSPLLLDLDRDGKLDILIPVFRTDYDFNAIDEGRLVAMTGEGKLLPGWPVPIPFEFDYSYSASDIDTDGHPEILYGAMSGTNIRVIDYRGQELSRIEAGNSVCGGLQHRWSPVSLPLALPINGMSERKIVTYTTDFTCAPPPSPDIIETQHRISIHHSDGSLINSWNIPFTFNPRSGHAAFSTPTAANVIDGSEPEILVPVKAGITNVGLFAYGLSGTLLPGWPHFTGQSWFALNYSVGISYLLNDVHAHALLKTLASGARLFAVDGSGNIPPGWESGLRPCGSQIGSRHNGTTLSPRLQSGERVVLELSGNCIVGYRANGTILPSYPRYQTAFTQSEGGGALSDLDHNGQLDFVTATGYGQSPEYDERPLARLYVWQTDFSATDDSRDWLRPRRDRYLSAVAGIEPQYLFSIGGFVRSQGEPVPGLPVSGGPLGTVVTDHDGHYRFERIKKGTVYQLRVGSDLRAKGKVIADMRHDFKLP